MSETSRYQAFLAKAYPQQRKSMVLHTMLDGEKVWLKRAAKRHSRLAYVPLDLLARLFKVDTLKPVPNLGGEYSILTEVARIKALNEAGIHVPRLLAFQPEAMLLADAGTTITPATTLQNSLKSTNSHHKIDHLLQLSIEALIEVHHRNNYLSEAFIRNILIVGDKTVFIDFETDPGTIYTPINCMVRDWYCFIFSLYSKLSQYRWPLQHSRLTPALINGLQQERADVREQFQMQLLTLLHLQKIPLKYMGKTGQNISQTLNALSQLQAHLI